MMKILLVFCILSLSFFNKLYAQSNEVIPDLEKLIEIENYKDVNKIIKERIPLFFKNKQVDTLDYYVAYLGKAALNIQGKSYAKKEIFSFIQEAKKTFPYHKEIVAIYFEAASFFSNIGDNQLAYKLIGEADSYFEHKRETIKANLPAIQSNLGDYAMRTGNYSLATAHYSKSIQLLKSNPSPNQEKLYFANNSMGIIMWYSSKLDSSIYYWDKAIQALKKMELTPLNKYFRVAIIQNNIAGCYGVMGKANEAIKMFEQVIQNNKLFAESSEPSPKKENSLINQFQAIDNLSKIYLDLGDFSKAHDLLSYSHTKKLNAFGNKSPEVYKSLVFLGTNFNNKHQYNKAISYLQNALGKIRDNGDTNTSWDAEAYSQLAMAYRSLKKNATATVYYEKAYGIFEKVYNGQYDDLYLAYLDEFSLYYAQNKSPEKALLLANKGLTYTLSVQGEKSLATFYKLKNLADVMLRLGRYKESLTYSNRGLKVVNNLLTDSKGKLDSVKIEMQKPQMILLHAKAQYNLIPKRDSQTIASMLDELQLATDVIEKRKSILTEQKDITLLMAGYKDLIDFIKQLNYDLYKLTNNKKHIDNLINIHESATYTRIRSRMDRQKAIHFANLPPNIQEEENKLKERIHTVLKSDNNSEDKILAYLKAVNDWTVFQAKLSREYPEYYKMRYASTHISIEELGRIIPTDVTVIRYVFSNDKLFALVASKNKQVFLPLSQENITEKIGLLDTVGSDPLKIGEIANGLYNQLWRPIEKEISGKRLVIIPDGVLYNLSFEMLTPLRTKNFSQLSKTCLLNKYAISYHYSLLALKDSKKPVKMKENFIAFTPGFSEEDKSRYLVRARKDSLHMDKTYMSLLPLPFTMNLAKKIKSDIGGRLFSQNASTTEVFRKEAGDHHIIYIGTHAEANNDYPEYSRLIFAKNTDKVEAENSIYLFDIYNCNLSSDLAVLTACESGKPGYQDGEGMISMAHAFKYAGSKSIMTGLWKIDEQSSTMITEWFYKNLQSGMTKDLALQKAKLKYLSEVNGRMLAPQYWAGLVIMGDTSPIKLESNQTLFVYWVIGGLVLIVMAYMIKRFSITKVG